MNDELTADSMLADSNAALAILRAQGRAHIPNDEAIEAIFRLGFSCGAEWLMNKIKEERHG